MSNKKPAADIRRSSTSAASNPQVHRLAAGLWKLGAGTGWFSVQGIASYLRPTFGECLAIADLSILAVVSLGLVVAILRGSDQTCERAFRLLRWITNRPEPPRPEAP
jgi:hypothetical protein